MKKQPKLNHCTKCKAHFSMEPGKHVCPPWMINNMTKPKVIELKRPPVPDEFCPECMSLKRKPNKECVNHNSYWINRGDLNDAIDELASLMVKKIANRKIQVEDTGTGKAHQRYWYLRGKEGIQRAVKSYKKSLNEAYRKFPQI